MCTLFSFPSTDHTVTDDKVSVSFLWEHSIGKKRSVTDLNATEFEALWSELEQALWKSQLLRQQHSYRHECQAFCSVTGVD